MPPLIGRAALAGSVLVSLFSIPSLSSDNPAGIDWAGWGVGLAIGLLNILGAVVAVLDVVMGFAGAAAILISALTS